jgi:hypothetical protein
MNELHQKEKRYFIVKNYYFNGYLDILDENTIDDYNKMFHVVVNDVEKFKIFCNEKGIMEKGITSTGIYYSSLEYGKWKKLNQSANILVYNKLAEYLNKIEDETKENDTMDNKEKTFNYSIEFKNGGFISEENCNKSFDEIFNSVKDLYNSAVFGGNVKKITIEMN